MGEQKLIGIKDQPISNKNSHRSSIRFSYNHLGMWIFYFKRALFNRQGCRWMIVGLSIGKAI